MKCGQRGCSCTTCEDCGKDREYCICELKEKTLAYVAANQRQEVEAYDLLLEWLETI
jgi:DTW domain-containing protein YfiP